MQNDKPFLELNAVNQSYGQRNVVMDFSLDLQAGEIGCLLGESGCGKTTVLRCIAGFESVDSGDVFLGGELIASAKKSLAAEKRQIGMVFQDYALFPHLTARENIGFGLSKWSRSEKTQRQQEMLQLVGLESAAELYPNQLSGGQQQRIALARALAPHPKLLLLDEPFSNLDVELRERLCRDVREIIKREGVTALMVTHDQNEAFAVADKVAVMHQGKIQQCDIPYNLYHRPANRFVANFIGKGVFLPGQVMSEGRIKMELGVLEGELQVSSNCEGQTVEVLLRPDDIVHDDKSLQTAEVIHKAFQGADILYTLRLPSGAEVLSLVPSHHNHALNEAIGICLVTDHVVAFVKN